MEKTYFKKFQLGTITCYGKAGCPVVVTAQLKPLDNKKLHWDTLEVVSCGWRFSAQAEVWSRNRKSMYIGGQILDELDTNFIKSGKEVPEILTRIVDFWKKYHLNDLNAGTIRQHRWLNENEEVLEQASHICLEKGLSTELSIYDYSVRLYALENIAKLSPDNGYKFGSKWLYKPIDDEDLVAIKQILS
jgi:hypothetical protein